MRTRIITMATVLVSVASFASGAHASSGAEATALRLINDERAARGLAALTMRADLVDVARRHSGRMAAADRIWHNGSLHEEVRRWRTLGENVGRGGTIRSIHDAFMRSDTHRYNIVLPAFTEVGVGVVDAGDGWIYVTQVFREPTGTDRADPEPPPAPPTSVPAGATEPAEPLAHARTMKMLERLLSLP